MSDPWKGMGGDLQSFGRKAVIVTPGPADLPIVAKAVLVLTAGNVTVVPVDNDDADTMPFTDLPAGAVIQLIVRKVTAATATVAAVIG